MENGDAPLSPLSGSVDIDRMLLSPSLPQLAGLGQEIPPSCFDGLHGGMEGLTIEQAGEQLGEGVVKQEPAEAAAGPEPGFSAAPAVVPLPNLLQAAAMLDPQHQQQVLQRVAEQQLLLQTQPAGPAAGLAPLPLQTLPQPQQAIMAASPAVTQLQQNMIALLAMPPALPPGGGGAPPGGALPLQSLQPIAVQLPPGMPAGALLPHDLSGVVPATAGLPVPVPGSPFGASVALPSPNYMVPLEAVGTAESVQPAASGRGGWRGGMDGVDGADQQQAQQPRRRGRKPKDESLLTEKQLRAREAQKRFRDRQKARVRDTEEGLEQVAAELEQERAQHESATLTNAVYEHMLEYKEQMLGALGAAHEFDPPPGIVIPPSMVEVMRRQQVTRDYTPESIMRYAAAGYTEHLDESGRVKEAPPFEAVAKDWGDIVEGLRQLLADARVSGSGDGAAAPGEDGHAADGGAAPVPPLHRGVARESAPGEFIELHSSREGGTPAASAQPSGSAGGPAQQAQQQDGVDGAMSPGVASPRAGDGDAEANSRPAEHMLGKAAASKKLPWATLDKGLELRDGNDLYRFTGPQLRLAAKLLKRSGALCWQQAILFPDNIMKLVAMRMDTCETCEEEEELPRWRHVVRSLRLRSGQLEQLVALHSEFLKMLRPALGERRTALQKLRQIRNVSIGTSQQSHIQRTLVINECTQALINSVQTQNAASVVLTAGIFNILDFPLQKMKLVVLSWPFYPQVHLLGTAAAMELGLDMEIYNAFNLLDTDEAAEGEDSAGATPGGRGGSGGGGGSGMMRDSSLGSMAAGASSGGAPLHSAQGMQGGGLDGMLGDDDMLAEVKLEWDPSDSMNMDAQ